MVVATARRHRSRHPSLVCCLSFPQLHPRNFLTLPHLKQFHVPPSLAPICRNQQSSPPVAVNLHHTSYSSRKSNPTSPISYTTPPAPFFLSSSPPAAKQLRKLPPTTTPQQPQPAPPSRRNLPAELLYSVSYQPLHPIHAIHQAATPPSFSYSNSTLLIPCASTLRLLLSLLRQNFLPSTASNSTPNSR